MHANSTQQYGILTQERIPANGRMNVAVMFTHPEKGEYMLGTMEQRTPRDWQELAEKRFGMPAQWEAAHD